MKNRKLLFFFSDEHCPSCATVVPTLAALAESIGYDFESYICVRPQSWPGKVLPAARIVRSTVSPSTSGIMISRMAASYSPLSR